ncbi:exported hypothetical protein [Candidatus Zixiibacteriota bacterium]|nr:exported hypothetical protein [candidate division Zixibacteria bacterium]
MTSRLLKIIILFLTIVAPAGATVYYVSPTGDDAASGLTPSDAWLSIDNYSARMEPGDTVNILPGTYEITKMIDIKARGTGSAPVVYRGFGGRPLITGTVTDDPWLLLEESCVIVENIEMAGAVKSGIFIKKDSSIVTDCYLHDIGTVAIRVDGSYNLVQRNVIARAKSYGIYNIKGAKYNRFYGNTVYDALSGVSIQVNEATARIINNVAVSCNLGIAGVAGNICAFNLLWDNKSGQYFGGAVDSAGGTIADPLFVDTASGDFHLNFGSPAIDAGMNLDYVYTGLRPDIGALETGELTRLEIVPSRDTLCADSAYQFDVIAYDSADGPAPRGNLLWSHTFATGNIDAGGLFTPIGTGSGRIVVNSDLGGVTAQTDLIYIRPGVLTGLSISPDTLTITAGTSQIFTALGRDKNAIEVSETGNLTWSVIGNIGDIDSSGLFTAQRTGQGIIQVESDLGFMATSDTITVTAGAPAYLKVLPATNIVQTLLTYQYAAFLYDIDSNLIGDFTDSVSWSTTDLVGNISASGLYTAGPLGNYWVKASYNAFGDSGYVSVVLAGGLHHVRIEYFDGTPVDSVDLSSDIDTTHLYARGYTLTDALIGDVSVDWSIVGPDSVASLTPPVGTNTELRLNKLGDIKVAILHSSGMTDTSGMITVISGEAASLLFEPETVTLTAGDTLTFAVTSLDADNNVLNPQPVPAWSVSGGIGTIDGSGLFTAASVGQGRIVVTAGGFTDSSGQVIVTPGALASINIEPDSVAVGIGDTIQFIAVGLDGSGNATSPGNIIWKALGLIGKIDSSGRYIAEHPGIGAVTAENEAAGIADTTLDLRVEELFFTTIPAGNQKIQPDGDEATIAEFSIDNYFTQIKTITSITIRDLSTGAGTIDELAGNMVAARVYLDTDGDSVRTAADSLLGETLYGPDQMTFTVPAIDIAPDSGRTFMVTARSARYARDGDSVDIALIPGVDIETADYTIVAGPALSNSIGVTEVDGMVAGQMEVVPMGNRAVGWADSMALCLAVDLPRNGYQSDTLIGLEIKNGGSATVTDFDSLSLFADNGDGIWNGAANEIPLGRLVFNGENWSRGGLTFALNNVSNRLYVASRIARFSRDGATINLEIPMQGIRVMSDNDGPLDQAVVCPDILTIAGTQAVLVEAVPITTRACVPGLNSGPMLAVTLTNGYSDNVTLNTCSFTFVGIDPAGGTGAQIASQIDSVYLYRNRDNDPASISAADTLLASGILALGKATFNISDLELSSGGGTCTVMVAAKLSLRNAKNANTIAFALADTSAIICAQPVRLSGTFPLANPVTFTINAFPAAAVTVHSLPVTNLYAGLSNQPVLDFEIPRNGYAIDRLTEINLANTGSLTDKSVFDNIRLWQDLTGNGYSTDDVLIGAFKAVSEHWRLDGISAALSLPSNRFVVTVSVNALQSYGGTLRFGIMQSGAKYLSGTTGPDDAAVQNATSLLLFPSNRITAISIPTGAKVVAPGSSGHTVMAFALYNGYLDQTKTLTQVTFTNNSYSVGTPDFADHELGQVSLYWDIDKNRVFDNDQLMGTGLFADGILKIEGFKASLASESLAYFFVVCDLPLDLNDADSLAVSVVQPSDFVFSDVVNLNGDLPLSGEGHLVIDGSIRRQYQLHGPNGRSLSPGDSNVVLMVFTPAYNGDQNDQLNQITLENLGTADTASIANLKLWRDVNGDFKLDGGDIEAGTFIYNNGSWLAQSLAMPISGPAPVLMITGDVPTEALSGATFCGAIPVLGCSYQSYNDGPIDSSLTASGTFTVSASDLRVSIEPLRSSYSVGQGIDVAMAITNKSAGQLDSILAEVVETINPQLVRLDSSTAGPVNLPSSEIFICHYYFTALGDGDVLWRLRSRALSTGDSSVVVQTPTVSIQRGISPVLLSLLNTSPTAVTKGQTNIFPLNLSCPHPDTGSNYAPLTLSSLKLRVIDGQGNPVAAANLFSRMVVATGLEILSVVQTVPSQSDILFSFNSPLIILPGTMQNLMLMVDIATDATVANFMISVDSASWVPFRDYNTSQVVPHAAGVIYPIRTSPTRVDAPSQQVAVSAESCTLPTVNFLQQGVDVLKLVFRHTGLPGSSAAQITKLTLAVVDSSGAPLAAGDLFDRITIRRQNYLVGDLTPLSQDYSPQQISLSAPLNLNPEEIDSLYIEVSIKSAATASGFKLQISDSTCFVARDLNTGSPLLTITDTELASGTVFPIISSWSAFRFPAEPLFVCLNCIAPSSVAGGADMVPLISLAASYPISEQYSGVRLTGAIIKITDSGGLPLEPTNIFDRIGIRVDGGVMQYGSLLPLGAGMLRVPFGSSGEALAPGDSATVSLYADLRPDVPYSDFALEILALNDIFTADVSDSQHVPGATPAPNCSQEFPYMTAPISILMPAGRPVLLHSHQPVRMAPAGSRQVTLFEGSLTYNSLSPVGQVEIDGFGAQLIRRGEDGAGYNDSISVEAVHLLINGTEIGRDSLLANNAIDIEALNQFVISRGDSVAIKLTCDLTGTAPADNFVLSFADSSFLRLIDKSLASAVYTVLPGKTYPYEAGEISITAAELKSSFTNYPNPFNPVRSEITTIGYVLGEDAAVDIDIFTITGDLVFHVAGHAPRSAGSNQSDTWDGRNGDGHLVQPGVYFCQITANYLSGRVESFRRKIAVVR